MLEQLNDEFLNVYLDTVVKKIENYARTEILLESKLIVAENKIAELQKQIEFFKKKSNKSIDYTMCDVVKQCNEYSTYKDFVEQVKVQGLWLEFGVSVGGSIRIIADLVPSKTVYGFDCWEGLPEDWVAYEGTPAEYVRHPKGEFKAEKPIDLPFNVVLVDGLFEDSIPKFLKEQEDKIAFIHIDCDLYSSTKTIFEKMKDRFQDGTIIVFDELIGYEGWEDHEYKAFHEFLEETGYSWEFIGKKDATIVAMRIYK